MFGSCLRDSTIYYHTNNSLVSKHNRSHMYTCTIDNKYNKKIPGRFNVRIDVLRNTSDFDFINNERRTQDKTFEIKQELYHFWFRLP